MILDNREDAILQTTINVLTETEFCDEGKILPPSYEISINHPIVS